MCSLPPCLLAPIGPSKGQYIHTTLNKATSIKVKLCTHMHTETDRQCPRPKVSQQSPWVLEHPGEFPTRPTPKTKACSTMAVLTKVTGLAFTFANAWASHRWNQGIKETFKAPLIFRLWPPPIVSYHTHILPHLPRSPMAKALFQRSSSQAWRKRT